MGVSSGDILRVVVDYALANSSKIQNSFWFEYDGSFAANEDVMLDLVAWVGALWGDAWQAYASNEANLTSFAVDKINPNGTVAENIGTEDVDFDGSITAETVSSIHSGLITAYTPLPKTRGSKYVPGASRDGVADNVLGSVLMAALAVMADVYVESYEGIITGGIYNPGVLRRAAEVFQRFDGSFLLTDTPSSQRRRKRGRGA